MFTNIVAIVCLIPSALNSLLIEDQRPSRGTLVVLGDEPNRSLSFDGHNDFVTVPACKAMSYPGTGGWTVELWVKPVAYPQSGEASIIGQESVGIAARDPWSFRIHPTYFEFRVDDANGASDSIKFDLTLGYWQHVACVYEQLEYQGQIHNTIAVYVHGQLIEIRSTNIEMESRYDPVYFGELSEHRYTGLVDEVRVWSKALKPIEVSLARIGQVKRLDSGLRAWWSFDETSGVVALDRSPSHAHAVLGKPHDPTDTASPERVLRTDTYFTRKERLPRESTSP